MRATEPVAETGLLTSRCVLIAVVEFELFFGLWLVFECCIWSLTSPVASHSVMEVLGHAPVPLRMQVVTFLKLVAIGVLSLRDRRLATR